MQLLTFTVAGLPYAIESRTVVEVLPLVPARPIPGAPDYVRGIFVCRGRLLPLVDLGVRITGRRPRERLSTRIMVVDVAPPDGGPAVRLGLVAEDVIAIRAADDASAEVPPLGIPGAPYIGRTLRLADDVIQVVDPSRLLPAELVARLAPTPATVPHP